MSGEPAVVVTSRSFGSGTTDPGAELAAHGLRVVRGPADHDLDRLGPLLGAAVAWIAGSGPVTAAHLDRAPDLRIVARYGTGTDAVDVPAARDRNVVVTNTPGANAAAVAEHAVGLMLACLRHLVEADRHVRAGRWPAVRGRELGKATVGIVGHGEVGRRVAAITAGFGSTVLAHDPVADVPDEIAAPIEAVLARADVLSLHCPPGAAPLIDATALAGMAADAVLVNTARAALLDEEAVATALHAGRLGALGADVLSGPSSPLMTAPHTVLTPHCAAQTTEAVDRMGRTAVAEVLRVVVHDRPPRHEVA